MKVTFFQLPPDVHQLDELGNDYFWSLSAEDRKRYCRQYLARLLNAKRLVRGSCCVCGATAAQGHHDNYDRPYEIVWLCYAHHREREREINKTMPPYNKRVTILPPLPQIRGVARQTLFVAKRRKEGLCVHCPEKAVTKTHCLKHAIETREKRRAEQVKRLGRPLLRRNNSLTYRLEQAA